METQSGPTGHYRTDEAGFTLIELMVVVLIIAILLAIAIPTFLGARNTANARSTQSNLRNSLTAEQAVYTNTQSFTASASSIEPSLTWETAATALTAGAKDVFAQVQTNANQIMLLAFGKDSNCYAIFASDDPTASFTAYAEYKSASSACAVPSGVPTAAPTATGNGVISSGSSAVTATAGWYRSW